MFLRGKLWYIVIYRWCQKILTAAQKFLGKLSMETISNPLVASATSTEERALVLLGQGIGPEIVAAAVGVSVSRISQLVSDPEFAAAIADLRFKNLSKHNERDNRYDALEDTLLEKLEALTPMMFKPGEVVNALTRINAAKRRGSSTPESILGTKEVVALTMPISVIQQFNQNFSVNVHNQVIKAGEQDLVTVQSVRMQDLLTQSRNKRLEQIHESNSIARVSGGTP